MTLDFEACWEYHTSKKIRFLNNLRTVYMRIMWFPYELVKRSIQEIGIFAISFSPTVMLLPKVPCQKDISKLFSHIH